MFLPPPAIEPCFCNPVHRSNLCCVITCMEIAHEKIKHHLVMPSGDPWVLRNDLLQATALIVVFLMKKVLQKNYNSGTMQGLLKSVDLFYIDFPFALQLKNELIFKVRSDLVLPPDMRVRLYHYT